MTQEKTVLVFGTFDGLHEGHVFFLNQAEKLGTKLIISVAQDSTVEKLKNHKPRLPISERIRGVKAKFEKAFVVPGDVLLGNWNVVKRYTPDIVAIGHDQFDLKEALQNSDLLPMPEIIVLSELRKKVQ